MFRLNRVWVQHPLSRGVEVRPVDESQVVVVDGEGVRCAGMAQGRLEEALVRDPKLGEVCLSRAREIASHKAVIDFEQMFQLHNIWAATSAVVCSPDLVRTYGVRLRCSYLPTRAESDATLDSRFGRNFYIFMA